MVATLRLVYAAAVEVKTLACQVIHDETEARRIKRTVQKFPRHTVGFREAEPGIGFARAYFELEIAV
jgi:hypothetical protein